MSGPRARHPEAGLDLCYLTDNLVVTSGPSSVWPKKAYRNPVDQLVAFLDKKHGEEWAIFEFRAEGTGYPDEEVYGRIHHFPWPDHHPPPFAIIPNLMAAMRNWLQEKPKDEGSHRVAVVHCKAGKGRSGTVSCCYLISQEGWRMEDALKRFTLRRMRAGFGEGVSIPSQLRWVRYVDQWTNKLDKKFIERPVEIVEIHVLGLKTGVKVCVEGYIEEGRRIKNFHTFTREEKIVVDDNLNAIPVGEPPSKRQTENIVPPETDSTTPSTNNTSSQDTEPSQNVILRPVEPVKLEGSDVNIDFERRNKSTYTGFAMVTSIAHVWFNPFFEGGSAGNDSGVFEIEWEAMDGIKGSVRKGIKALDRLKVIWKYSEVGQGQTINEPELGEPVKEGKATNWRGEGNPEKDIESKNTEGVDSGRIGGATLTLSEMSGEAVHKLMGKDLGLRKSDVASANVSRASSVRDDHTKTSSTESQTRLEDSSDVETEQAVQSHVANEEELQTNHSDVHETHDHERMDTVAGKYLELGIARVSTLLSKLKGPDDSNSDEQTTK